MPKGKGISGEGVQTSRVVFRQKHKTNASRRALWTARQRDFRDGAAKRGPGPRKRGAALSGAPAIWGNGGFCLAHVCLFGISFVLVELFLYNIFEGSRVFIFFSFSVFLSVFSRFWFHAVVFFCRSLGGFAGRV